MKFFLSVLLFIFYSSNMTSQQVITNDLKEGKYENSIIKITQQLNLNNKQIEFSNCTIEFTNKGNISNGILVGQNNIIKSQNTPVFNNVIIKQSFTQNPYYISWWYEPSSIHKQLNNSKIQEIFNSIPNSSKLVFDSAYNILCDPVFTITDKVDINVDFKNSHFFTDHSAGGSSNFFLFKNCQNIILKNLHITGDTKFHKQGDKGEWGMGICIRGCNNIIINNSKIDQCWGDNIYIAGGDNYSPSNNIYINNCMLVDGRRNNISIINASGIYIDSCTILKTTSLPDYLRATPPFTGIDLEPNDTIKEKVADFIIKNSRFDLNNIGKVGVQNYNNPKGKSIKVINCTFNNMDHAFFLTASNDIIIDSCILNNINSEPIILRNVSQTEITNNKFSGLPDINKPIEKNFQIINSTFNAVNNSLIRK